MITTNDWSVVCKRLGFRQPKAKPTQQKTFKCRACGGNMTAHLGTNVYTCDNMVEKEKANESGKTIKVVEPCGNVALQKYILK